MRKHVHRVFVLALISLLQVNCDMSAVFVPGVSPPCSFLDTVKPCCFK